MAMNLGGLRHALGIPQPTLPESALRRGRKLELFGKVLNCPHLVAAGRQLVDSDKLVTPSPPWYTQPPSSGTMDWSSYNTQDDGTCFTTSSK